MIGNNLNSSVQLDHSRDEIRRALSAAPATPGQVVNQWLTEHPVKLATDVIGDVTKTVVTPLAQRNPMMFVLSAAVVGGLLVWTRPWSWLFKPAVIGTLVPQIVAKALAYVPTRNL